MPIVRKITLTYTETIQLAPYNTVTKGLVVEVEPRPEDGPDAIHDLEGLIATTWDTVGPATHRQVRTAVEEFDLLQEDRRQRLTGEPARNGGGASHAPTEPPPSTAKQRTTIAMLRESLNWTVADLDVFAAQVGLDMARLTTGEARALLQALHQQEPKPRAEPAPASPPEPETEGEQPQEVQPQGEPEPQREAATPSSAQGPPATPAEAEKRFYNRYEKDIGGTTFPKVREFLGELAYPKPATVEAWVALAETVRAKAKAKASAAAT